MFGSQSDDVDAENGGMMNVVRLVADGEIVFEGELEIAPVVGDIIRLSGSRYFKVIRRRIDIDLRGIDPTMVIAFMNSL